MNISFGTPPNYEEIVKRFPAVKNNKGVVFTYGEILYIPGAFVPPSDLQKHEEVHSKQHKNFPGGAEAWWKKYLTDREFRLHEELEAYGHQYLHICQIVNRKGRIAHLHRLADDLSSPIYGNAIKKKQALSAILEVYDILKEQSEKLTPTPMDMEAQAPVAVEPEVAVEAPAEAPAEVPAEMPVEAPVVEAPAETPVEAPAAE